MKLKSHYLGQPPEFFKRVQGYSPEPLLPPPSQEKPFGFTGNVLPDDYGRTNGDKGLGFIGFTGESDQAKSDYGSAAFTPSITPPPTRYLRQQNAPNMSATVIALTLAGSIMFAPQMQEFGQDIENPKDMIDKTLLISGSENVTRTKDIPFNIGSAMLNADQTAELSDTAHFLNKYPNVSVKITGCASPTEAMNLKDLRGDYTKGLLTKEFGVDPQRVTVVSAKNATCDLAVPNAVQLTMEKFQPSA